MYKKIKLVGEGKFAEISKAVNVISNQVVALRTLKLTETAALSMKRFRREAIILSSIIHPNIVRCYGITKTPRTFILEYCEQLLHEDGEMVPVHSLSGILSILEDDLQICSKLKIMYDISYGLSYLHGLGIIAGDIKPSNILVNNHWVFKIADFSVETFERHKNVMLSTTIVNNSKDLDFTLYYLAPELMKEGSLNCDKTSKTDIYSFAVLSFEVIFPVLKFRIHNTATDHIEAVKQGWRPTIPPIADELVLSLCNLCSQSWDEHPDNRLDAIDISNNVRDLIKKVSLYRI